MPEAMSTLLKHRSRVNEIARVLVKQGLGSWAARLENIVDIPPVERMVHGLASPDELGMSDGERLRNALAELGTTFVKFGQMLSLRPDVVGNDVADDLRQLRADVPPDPPDTARQTVEAQLGAPVAELYRSFEAEPFASGSVAQVHRATLADGTPVAVKVVHDGADRKVREDLELLQALASYLESGDAEIARLRPMVIVAEFASMMDAAIDMRQELQSLQQFRANFADEHDVVIPRPYPMLSGDKVLTMEMLSGGRLVDRESVEAAGWDVDELVRRSADIYLEMIFRDGLYHADPQPANLLLPDATHIGILDFGDVGRVTTARRRQLETLVIAIDTRDIDSLVDVVLEMTTPPPGVDVGGLRAAIEMWVNRYLLIGIGRLDMEGIVRSGMQLLHDHQLVLPADLAVLFRVVIQLQGLGRGLDTDVRVLDLLRPYLGEIVKERYDPRRMLQQFARSARRWEHFIRNAPDDLQEIARQVRTGNVGVELRIHDADHAVDRLVDGLITASSFVAGAQLISRRTNPLVGSYSVPGLVAASIGVVTWQRLVLKRRPRQTWVTRARKVIEVKRR
jgi:ubiquinone biosynthesis protein